MGKKQSRYKGYKPNTNSRGLASGAFSTPVPKNQATTMEADKDFQKICERATKRIQELKEAGGGVARDLDGNKRSLPDEVKCTARQYRKFRNKYGLAYEFGRA